MFSGCADARARAKRVVTKGTAGITLTELDGAYQAVALTNCLGRIMASKLDITWSLQGVLGVDAVRACQDALLPQIDAFFQAHGDQALYFWVLEEGSSRGIHSHFLLYLAAPDVGSFTDMVCAAVAAITGRSLSTQEHQSSVYVQPHPEDETSVRQWERFSYMIKGVDTNGFTVAERAMVTKFVPTTPMGRTRLRFQGYISAPRIGMSHALGAGQIEQWKRRLALPSLSIFDYAERPYNDRFLHWHDEHCAEVVAASLNKRI